jgi:hypothetical protein
LNTPLETWLHDKFSAACAAAGQWSSPSGPRISPPPAPWEEEFFLLGLNENLFEMDERGQVASELLPARLETGAAAKSYRIFSHDPVRLLRENVCQLASAARLIFERGWLRHHLSLEPGRDEHHSTPDQFDLLVRSPAGEILIWVEARRSAAELHKLIADLRACSRRGAHSHQDCGFPQNHPRHQFCLANGPAYLWAVAPDADISFEVTCNGAALELEPLASLPPRSLLELGQS